MEHVVVRREPQKSPPALMMVRSQELALNGCAFLSASGAVDDSGSAVVWTMAPARDPDAGRIRLTNTVFSSPRTALRFASPPTRVEIDNCLKHGGGMLEFEDRSSDREITVVAQHTTLRQATWLCSLSRSHGVRTAGQLHLVLRDSAFDLRGPGAALVRLVSPVEPSNRARPIQITGGESVIRPDIPIVGWSKRDPGTVTPVDSHGLVVEGLAVGDFQFIGPFGAPAASAIDRRSLGIPRQSDEPPGVIVTRLAGALQTVLR
jgi:hypothetical protein